MKSNFEFYNSVLIINEVYLGYEVVINNFVSLVFDIIKVFYLYKGYYRFVWFFMLVFF